MSQRRSKKQIPAVSSAPDTAARPLPSKEEGGGVLYVIATPIGNLEDITQRAIRVLQEVSCVAAEDTRHTRKLLSHLGIQKKIISYYKHREAIKAQEIIKRIARGERVALVSDAGTPCISDPGALLVRAVRDCGYRIIPIPGVSALTAALSVSGAEAPFSFFGFLPARSSQRKKILCGLEDRDETLIFYESPRRILSLLKEIQNVWGERDIVVARELTKVHEELLCGPVGEVGEILAGREKLLGEFVVILPVERQPKVAEVSEEEIGSRLARLQNSGHISMRDAVAQVCQELGVARSLVYRLGLVLWKKDLP